MKTPPFKPHVSIRVRSSDRSETVHETDRAEYFYPHEIPNLKVQSVHDVAKALNSINGDSATKFMKLAPEYKRLDCIWDIWDKDELLDENSYFASAIDEEQRVLIERHAVIVYGCFLEICQDLERTER